MARSRVLLGVSASVAAVVGLAASAQAAPYAYVANADGNGPSNVSQFNVGAGGLLSALSPATVPAGSGPAGVAVSPDGKSVYVTNLSDNTLSQYTVGTGGTLSPKTPDAVGADDGPEGLAVSPNGKNVYVAASFSDRILHENITVYDVASDGSITPRGNVRSYGDTPHHVAVSPDGKSLYATQCCTDAGVAQFNITANGGLVGKSPPTAHIEGEGGDVAVSPDGKSVYVTSYVGSAVFQFNVGAGGTLSPKTPAIVAAAAGTGGVVVSPDGRSVYVAGGGGISQFNVGSGGKLSPKNPATVASGGGGTSGIAMTPDGRSLYRTTDRIEQFDVGAAGGRLTPKSPATVLAGSAPYAIAVNPLGGPASVSVLGTTLVVTAGIGNKDNLVVTRPLPGSLRVTNGASGPYTGSAVTPGAGCTQVDSETVKCNASGINLIRVSSHDEADKVTNSTGINSSLFGEKGADTLLGGNGADTLTGGPDVDVMKGRNGNDQLLAHDLTSDATINCDGGSAPGTADKADLDLLPKDPNSVVIGCESKTRH